MILRCLVVFLALVALHAPLHAQQCAQGLAGMPNCLPPDHPSSPHRSGSGPNSSGGVWKSQYAVVVTGKGGVGFTAMGPADTRREAEKAAFKACRERGGQDCKLVVAFSNQCAAVAWGEMVRTVGTGPTTQMAESIAMRKCVADTKDCKIYFSDCMAAQRVR